MTPVEYAPHSTRLGGGNLEPFVFLCDTEMVRKGDNMDELIVEKNCRVRKMTPKECFRAMGFDDADVDLLIENGISNTQLYKMAGNSIVVNVLEFLFCQLFDNDNELWV